MKPETWQYYLHDLGVLLMEQAMETKAARDGCSDDKARLFQEGQLFAYHTVISLMQQQAEAFQIPLGEMGLSGIDPERDLI